MVASTISSSLLGSIKSWDANHSWYYPVYKFEEVEDSRFRAMVGRDELSDGARWRIESSILYKILATSPISNAMLHFLSKC